MVASPRSANIEQICRSLLISLKQETHVRFSHIRMFLDLSWWRHLNKNHNRAFQTFVLINVCPKDLTATARLLRQGIFAQQAKLPESRAIGRMRSQDGNRLRRYPLLIRQTIDDLSEQPFQLVRIMVGGQFHQTTYRTSRRDLVVGLVEGANIGMDTLRVAKVLGEVKWRYIKRNTPAGGV